MSAKQDVYVDPFDYWARRKNKNMEGRFVYAYAMRDGVKTKITDPFVVLGTFDRKTYALRLKTGLDEQLRFSIGEVWHEPYNFIIEDKIIKNIFDTEIINSQTQFSLHDLQNTKITVDLARWYVLKELGGSESPKNAEFISRHDFNTIMMRLVRFEPFGLLADYYSFTNWKEEY